MTQSTDSNLVTRYLAKVSDKGKLEVHSCVFEKKPKSWRRKDDRKGWDDPFGWRSVFTGGLAPGFESPAHAMEFLLTRARESIASAETRLAQARSELAIIESQCDITVKS